jgi:hypothetical protein
MVRGVDFCLDLSHTTFVAEECMSDNYFNTDIVNNHDQLMYLNNSMAECYDFCLRFAEQFDSESDKAWWYSMKKGHLCYDV